MKHITEEEINAQLSWCEKNAEKLPAGALALVDTYGCQQNEADSEKIRGYLKKMGCGFTDDPDKADVIVINTCAIREHAENRVMGNIGALVHSKRRHPGQIICVCGCMMNEEHRVTKIRESYRHVNLTFSPQNLWRFPELLGSVLEKKKRIFAQGGEDSVAENIPLDRQRGTKAWVSVMYGCNNFCSYCIVPYVRGRERSRKPEDILKEVRELIAGGCKDVTLLGQNVNSYGKDLETPVTFAQLLRMVNEVEGDFLIRFMTSHPKDASPELFRAMQECEKVAPQLHLPVQSGSSRVLKAMNRGYSREEYLEKVRQLRELIPDIVLTSDIIVGFPGETEAEFEETLSLIEEVGYDALFTFIFSPRKGTPASTLEDPIPAEEKSRWFDRLVETQNAVSQKKHLEYVGTEVRVLVDGEGRDGKHNLSARTDGGRLVHLNGDIGTIGTFQTAKITGASTWALFGELK